MQTAKVSVEDDVLSNVEAQVERNTPSYKKAAASIDDLPPALNRRWPPALKSQLLHAIDAGLLSVTEASDRYTLPISEIASWRSEPSRGQPLHTHIEPRRDDRISRLLSLMVLSGMIRQSDADYIEGETDTAWSLERFMVGDELII